MHDEWLKNLIAERDQVRERLAKLDVFLASERLERVSRHHQLLLPIQQSAMQSYLRVLDARLEGHGHGAA